VGRFVETTDNATVESDISVVSSKLVGYVREVRAAHNQFVRAGDVLAVLESGDFAVRVAQAQAALEAQRASIETIDSQIAQEQAMIAQADATVASAEADLALAHRTLERDRTLSATGVVSGSKLDASTADERKASAALSKARAGATAERSRLPVLAGQRATAVAQLGQLQASLDLAKIDLDNTVIRAPIDGVVGNRSVQVGQLVRMGEQLLSVVPLDTIYVVANFKETQIADMRRGQPVRISVDAFPGRVIVGELDSFAPASGAQFSLLPPENATGNFTKIVQRVPVKIALPKNDPVVGALRPGLSVEASVDTSGTAGSDVAGLFGTAHAAEAPAR
jgi:membrane fusion protein (multidrug efflux system)